ncbi:MAG: DUF559 domain-containing protein [Chloroflexi bacterium]|nr:DUF559 domain-containing protein [Chloroflexota bacterium]
MSRYNRTLKPLARELRKNSTLSEVLLWNRLKGRQLKGYRFSMQRPIDNYIVDFYCSKLKLAIEIDGMTHDYKLEKDAERQMLLESFGVNFLRFQDRDIKQNLEGVLIAIENWIDENEAGADSTTPAPP